MTQPDDIVTGALAYLYTKPDLLAVLGSDDDGPWLFGYRLWAVVEKSESTAVVISHDGGWAGANLEHTLRFPRLQIDIYADPRRDMGNNGNDPGEVQRRVNHVFETLDKHLHRVDSGTQMWGGVRTVASARLTEPTIYAVPDGDGLLRAQIHYGITQG